MKRICCGLVIIIMIGCGYTPSKTYEEPIYNSEYDRSVFEVEQYLKENLKDPKSFEAITWGDVQKISPTKYLVYC